MKPIAEVYPDCVTDKWGFHEPSDYQPMLDSFGLEIILQVDDADYQGDSRLLFRHPETGAYGLLIFGWGSCSGCDALQQCESLKEIEDLREGLHRDIRWYSSKEAMLEYIKTKDWGTEYSWHAEETRTFVEKAIALLSE